MKYAVIIKHPFREWDYRVDVVEVSDQVTKEDIYTVIMRKMLGPFEILSITEKIDNRDISNGLEELHRETENHIQT